ncbi:hypothetical protein FA13DRAFT_1739157 [Coprinellus micaceus]|uniref:DUF4238 domain-containing protein n=1 Tax=Coprinellus micaceus TaxID=71717 RepID=A0A4Y7STL5_COPMI|nr:hypothetical protein FA13DRAFT_1739157 [Coprinellus micaceus]
MPPQYHHYIPRFILRQFQTPDPDGSDGTRGSTKSRRERERDRARAQRLGLPVNTEDITVFDMATQSIKAVPLAKAFGFANLYEDPAKIGDAGHLEKKLASLERDASVVLNKLYARVTEGADTFTIPRPELELMRKFLFLMHYRRSEHIKTYFQEDHPGNADIRDWIHHLKEQRGYTSDSQIWLDGLRYYLDTPHSDIMAASQQQPNRIDGNLDVNTPADQWHSVAYAKYSSQYFMGIWRASEASEFVLGDNSYGLWEGQFMGETGLFHIYVVSPQITLVLKMSMAKGQSAPSAFEHSTLSNHPLNAPSPLYVKTQSTALRIDDLPSLISQDDRFTYTIHRLSHHQTYLVNQVVLSNLGRDGLLVFSSVEAMAKTARLFDTPPGPNTLSKANRRAVQALASCLSGPGESNGPNDGNDGSSRSKGVVTHLLLLPPSDESRSLKEDRAFNALLVRILSGEKTFRSDYDRAQHIYRRLPVSDGSAHPFVEHVRQSVLGPISFASIVADRHGALKGRFGSDVSTRTVSTLSSTDSRRLLDCSTKFLEAIGTPSITGDLESRDSLQKLAGEVSVVMFLESLLEVDANLVAGLCPAVDFVQPADAYATPIHGEGHLPAYHGGVRLSPWITKCVGTMSFIIFSLFFTLTMSALFVE